MDYVLQIEKWLFNSQHTTTTFKYSLVQSCNALIYYINRSISTKVDSTYLGYWPIAHSVYVLWRAVGANP